MKIYGKLLVLYALCPNVAAFSLQTPKSVTTSLNARTQSNVAGSEAASKFVGSSAAAQPASAMFRTADLWQSVAPVLVQGGSLRTCSFDESIDRVLVLLKTDGRPLNANVDLWQGPDNTPQKMAVYLEDGSLRPFRAVVETPGATNTISILNTAQIEYPLTAGLDASSVGPVRSLSGGKSRLVQGGAVYTVPLAPAVASAQILLTTDGRPLTARIELLQGPNNIKQVMEIYLEDGKLRPFGLVLETPGAGNVVRIQNTATMEYPLSAFVEPYLVESSSGEPGSEGMTWR